MIYLYGNGNTDNHGCEALSRTLRTILGADVTEYVSNAGKDELKPKDITQINLEDSINEKGWLGRTVYRIAIRLKQTAIRDAILYKSFVNRVQKDDICISIGGDNYCYGDISWLEDLNKMLSSRAKTILMGNSIEPELLQRKDVLQDMKNYSLVIARESLTFEALCKAGLEKTSRLIPDTAFLLPVKEWELPQIFSKRNMVAINISPTIMDAGAERESIYNAYCALIEEILKTTDLGVALVPHVVWSRSDDRVPSRNLYDKFQHTGRVVMIENRDCRELKYVISKCRFALVARTHASIAAYSSNVPTVVIGYSIKARGIAKDLFGDWENYVIPAENITSSQILIEAFQWLLKNENEIRKRLTEIMPEYINKINQIQAEIKKL